MSHTKRQYSDMPLLLENRAATLSPLPLITTEEARMTRVSLSSSTWLRVRKGIYTNRGSYASAKPWIRYQVRVHAFARQHPDAILCLESAAVIHGIPLFGETRDIHVYSPDRKRARRFGDVVVHTGVDLRTLVRVNGVLATSLLDTAVDLSRVLPAAHALTVVDSVISPTQGGPLTIDELNDHATSQCNRRGTARLRWVFGRADGLSESPGESVSRAVIGWCGFEEPELQHEFHYSEKPARSDFYFPSNRAIGESDGWQKYLLEDPEKAAEALADEKRREDLLRSKGHPFARWDLSAATRVDPLAAALTNIGVRRIGPAQTQMLATLKDRSRQMPFKRRPTP